MTAVIDGVGGALAGAVARVVAPNGPGVVRPGDLLGKFPCVVLLLPLHVEGQLPHVTHDVLSVLSMLADDPVRLAEAAARVVTVWCTTADRRARLAIPPVSLGAALANSATQFLGTSWHREQRHHGGDIAAAVRCRSVAIRRMLDVHIGHSLGGVPLAQVAGDVMTVDPNSLHTVAVRLAGGRWAGAGAVAAAVHHR
jgi:hypothetical protein